MNNEWRNLPTLAAWKTDEVALLEHIEGLEAELRTRDNAEATHKITLREVQAETMRVQTKYDALLADNERLREAIEAELLGCDYGRRDMRKAFNATPAQSLARIRNQVFEKVAGWINTTDLSTLPPEKAAWLGNMLYSYAEAIRAMKEPE